MAAVCEVCGKHPSFGIRPSHGAPADACTSCIKPGKVVKRPN